MLIERQSRSLGLNTQIALPHQYDKTFAANLINLPASRILAAAA